MKREIKFRAWASDLKMMFNDYAANHLVNGGMDVAHYHSNSEAAYVKDLILMQYTGLKDKNGKEVYEGDICKWPSENLSQIVWDEKACFTARAINHNRGGRYGIVTKYIEVVGNIYEHPELTISINSITK